MDIDGCGVYAFISPSGMAYIGSSKNLKQRHYEHLWSLKRNKHHCVQLQKAWNKYASLRFEILEHCLIEKLIEREQHWIDVHFERFLGLYNSSLTAGKMTHSAESRAKISKARKGKKSDPEVVKKIADKLRGRKRDPKIVEKIAKANRGQKRSEETKKKISDSKRGKSYSLGRKYKGAGLLAMQQSAARAREAKVRKQIEVGHYGY